MRLGRKETAAERGRGGLVGENCQRFLPTLNFVNQRENITQSSKRNPASVFSFLIWSPGPELKFLGSWQELTILEQLLQLSSTL